ncbi:hypothetical protein M4I33_03750 [Clostridium sp. LY3-2]|uniref:hypothetical protein n=1 Tax=Clostridium sp. LY3-2 TaxID=2942482 RepID=UPI0021524659|nr:hypothetical protein [Clostridium sp. LY3-2]MCR6513990.1 hypothetical protein [Clostridium sp. LY3-2]
MKFTLNIIMVLGILAIIFIVGSIVLNNKKKNSIVTTIESKLVDSMNSITFIGVFFTIITLIVSSVGIIYTIKEPKLEINFKTPHYALWEEENGNDPLYLVQDNDGHIDYEITQPGQWHITLVNYGDKTIDKITVKVKLSDIFFIDQEYEYNMIDHLYGHGGYGTLERTFTDIDPGCEINLPYFPFNIVGMDENYETNQYKSLDSINMKVELFINDKKNKSKEYKIDIKKDSTREDWFF